MHRSPGTKYVRVLAVCGVTVLLAGCLDVSRVNNSGFGRYSNSTATYAARSGEIPLVVLGNPTDAPQTTFDKAVAQGLDGTYVIPGVKFVPEASSAPEGYRTVVYFGGVGGRQACEASEPPPQVANGGAVTAAFCLDRETLSYADGEMPVISGVDDPLLQNQMTALGLEIFPPENPNYIGGDCGPKSGGC